MKKSRIGLLGVAAALAFAPPATHYTISANRPAIVREVKRKRVKSGWSPKIPRTDADRAALTAARLRRTSRGLKRLGYAVQSAANQPCARSRALYDLGGVA